jgi:hypothetical protein
MKVVKFLIIIGFVQFFTSCDISMFEDTATVPKVDTVTYTNMFFWDKYPQESMKNYAEINTQYTLPDSVLHPELCKAFKRVILDSIVLKDGQKQYTSAVDFAYHFLKGYKDDSIKGEKSLSRELFQVSNVWYNKNGIFSVRVGRGGFSKGSKGFNHAEYRVFDVKTGAVLSLSDIFEGDYKTEIEKIGEKYFKTEMGIAENVALKKAGYFVKDNKFHINNNFYIDENSVHFFYNPSEISAGTQGPSSVTIPNDALKGLKRKR